MPLEVCFRWSLREVQTPRPKIGRDGELRPRSGRRQGCRWDHGSPPKAERMEFARSANSKAQNRQGWRFWAAQGLVGEILFVREVDR
jgi:predicted nucleic acid-binding Zn ribbon protein